MGMTLIQEQSSSKGQKSHACTFISNKNRDSTCCDTKKDPTVCFIIRIYSLSLIVRK